MCGRGLVTPRWWAIARETARGEIIVVRFGFDHCPGALHFPEPDAPGAVICRTCKHVLPRVRQLKDAIIARVLEVNRALAAATEDHT